MKPRAIKSIVQMISVVVIGMVTGKRLILNNVGTKWRIQKHWRIQKVIFRRCEGLNSSFVFECL